MTKYVAPRRRKSSKYALSLKQFNCCLVFVAALAEKTKTGFADKEDPNGTDPWKNQDRLIPEGRDLY